MAYKFQIKKNKIKLLKEHENGTQKVLLGNAMLATVMSGRKYDVIPRNINCSGGGVEYLHRDPASRRRRRKGKSQI
jgi:hypothetical protein